MDVTWWQWAVLAGGSFLIGATKAGIGILNDCDFCAGVAAARINGRGFAAFNLRRCRRGAARLRRRQTPEQASGALAKDYERLPETVKSLHILAFVILMPANCFASVLNTFTEALLLNGYSIKTRAARGAVVGCCGHCAAGWLAALTTTLRASSPTRKPAQENLICSFMRRLIGCGNC